MRILWVKAGKLLPVDTGGKIRSFHILRKLARNNTVTTLSYYGGMKDPDYDGALAKELPGAHCIHTRAPASSFLDSIITRLKDPQLRRKYERTAPRLPLAMTGSNIARQVEDVLHDAIGSTHPAQLVTS